MSSCIADVTELYEFLNVLLSFSITNCFYVYRYMCKMLQYGSVFTLQDFIRWVLGYEFIYKISFILLLLGINA